ncbi:hypothetical protein ACFX2H_006945 [Malus domestica]
MATKENCSNLSSLLHVYCKASGQQISLKKSIVYFWANTPTHLALELCNNLDMLKVDNPRKYLGIPTIWWRSKRDTLEYVNDLVWLRLQGGKDGFFLRRGMKYSLK